MIPAIIITLVYFGSMYFGWIQTKKLKEHLVEQGAISPETATFVDKNKYFVLTTQFPMTAIIEEPDGAIWFDFPKWRPMLILFGVVVFITFITLLFLIISLF